MDPWLLTSKVVTMAKGDSKGGGNSNGSGGGSKSESRGGGHSVGGGFGSISGGHGLGKDNGHGGFSDGFSSAVGGNYSGNRGNGGNGGNRGRGSSFGGGGNDGGSSISRARDSFGRRSNDSISSDNYGVNDEGLASSLSETPNFGFESKKTKDDVNLSLGGYGSVGTQEQKSAYDKGFTDQANMNMATNSLSTALTPALGGLITGLASKGASTLSEAMGPQDAFTKAGREAANDIGPMSNFDVSGPAESIGNAAINVGSSLLGPAGSMITNAMTANALMNNPSYQATPSIDRAKSAFTKKAGDNGRGSTSAPSASMASQFMQPPSISGNPTMQLSDYNNEGYDLVNKFTPGN